MRGRDPKRHLTVKLALLGLMAIPITLILGPTVGADVAEEVKPPEEGQGWYWEDRPPDPAGAQASRFFGTDGEVHLYVGWDANPLEEDPRDYISGVLFDLFSLGMTPGSTITRFQLTALQHSRSHTGPPNEGNDPMAEHGIVACPFPDFGAGNINLPLTPDTGGDCDSGSVLGTKGKDKVVDPYSKPPAQGADTRPKEYWVWTFELTAMMQTLWSSNQNTAISLEPNPEPADDAACPSQCRAEFHMGTYSEPYPPPPGVPTEEKPGIFATIEWEPAAEEFGEEIGLEEPFFEETFTEEEVPPSDVGAPADTEVTEEPPEDTAPSPIQGRRTAVQGTSADFWDIPALNWILGLLMGGFLVFSGWAVTSETAMTQRPPGAISALMRKQ